MAAAESGPSIGCPPGRGTQDRRQPDRVRRVRGLPPRPPGQFPQLAGHAPPGRRQDRHRPRGGAGAAGSLSATNVRLRVCPVGFACRAGSSANRPVKGAESLPPIACVYTPLAYAAPMPMQTVAETEVFQRYASALWSDDERGSFVDWIAANPKVGDVIPGSGGCRKVRWGREGMGKRGGARVIYFNGEDGPVVADRLRQGEIRQPAGRVSGPTQTRGGAWIKTWSSSRPTYCSRCAR